MSRQWEKSEAVVSERYRKASLVFLFLITVVAIVAVVLLVVLAILQMQESNNYSGWLAIALMSCVAIVFYLWLMIAVRLNSVMYRIHFRFEKLDS